MFKTKAEIRNHVWGRLEKEGIAIFPPPCRGRIPNFKGSASACEKIKDLEEFRKAKAVFCAPDHVLKRIREIVLEEGKILVVALPKMSGFVQIEERDEIAEATTIKGFVKYGRPVKHKIDLFVQGCAAVDLHGNRIGKGTGFGDKEWDYLFKRGLLNEGVKVVVVAHEYQIFEDFSHLMDKHDKRINVILTPSRVIRV